MDVCIDPVRDAAPARGARRVAGTDARDLRAGRSEVLCGCGEEAARAVIDAVHVESGQQVADRQRFVGNDVQQRQVCMFRRRAAP